jgi:hypothetical protein
MFCFSLSQLSHVSSLVWRDSFATFKPVQGWYAYIKWMDWVEEACSVLTFDDNNAMWVTRALSKWWRFVLLKDESKKPDEKSSWNPSRGNTKLGFCTEMHFAFKIAKLWNVRRLFFFYACILRYYLSKPLSSLSCSLNAVFPGPKMWHTFACATAIFHPIL